MFGFKTVSAKERRVDTICSAAVAALAAIVYWCTLPDCAFPGEPARLAVEALGLDPAAADVPQHMIWGWVASAAGAFPDPVAALNVLSAICGVASAWLLCGTMTFYVRECCDDEAASAFSSSTARVAGVGAALVFIFSLPAWESATHAGFRMFDVMAMLAVFRLAVTLARHPRFQIALSACMGAATALGMLESPSFFPLSLVYMLALAASVHKSDCARGEDARPRLLPSLFAFLAVLPVVFFGGLLIVSAVYSGTPSAADRELVDIGKIAVRIAGKMRAEARMWLPSVNWVWILLFGIFPVAASVISSIAAFGRDRHKASQCAFHVALTACLIVAVAPSDFPVRPSVILRPTGHSPAMLYTGLAAVAGYLLAYWYLLLRGPAPEKRDEDGMPAASGSAQRVLAMAAGGLLVVVLPVSAGMDSLSMSSSRGAFADKSAGEVLDALGGRRWLVTRGGWLDDHLRLVAAKRGATLRILSLNRTNSKMYLKKLAEAAEAEGMPGRVVNAASIGVGGFLSTWLENDPDARGKLAVFDTPDIWYQSDAKERLRPVPDAIFFSGEPDGAVSRETAAGAKERFFALWERMEPFLEKPVEAEAESLDGLFKQDMRRHIGFIGNSTGAYLQDAGLDREAFDTYALVNGKIDENNISALFNLFEMSQPDYKYSASGPGDANPAARHRAEYKRKVDEFAKRALEDHNFRFGLPVLASTYGRIRSPRGALMLTSYWMQTGKTRAAIAELVKALPMFAKAGQAELYSYMAMIYGGMEANPESERQYRAALEKDPGNKNALRGLVMLSLQKGDREAAIDYFEKIKDKDATGESKPTIEAAFVCLAKRDIYGAREMFQKLGVENPDDPKVQGMLCYVMVMQAEIARRQSDEAGRRAAAAKDKKEKEELQRAAAKFAQEAEAELGGAEKIVLPRLKAMAAGNDPEARFAYHVSRAHVGLARGPKFKKAARDDFYKALRARPYVSSVADMVLRLDLELADAKSARQHAKQILDGNNHHAFANYTMGSLFLHDGDYAAAAMYLKGAESDAAKDAGQASAARRDVLSAQIKNDLAEVYRRTGSLEEAEKKAREAIEAAPDMYVAHLTLAGVMLDAGKDPEVARKTVEKSLELFKESNPDAEVDLRLRMLLVRAQAECGDSMRARGGLREIKKARIDVLSAYEREELEKLEAIVARASAQKKKQ